MRRLQDIGMPNEMQWGIYPLYESVIVNVQSPRRMSNSENNNIGLKDDQSFRSWRNQMMLMSCERVSFEDQRCL